MENFEVVTIPNIDALATRFLIKNTMETIPTINFNTSSIREIHSLIDIIEAKTHYKFIRLEMGVPSSSPPIAMVEAEIEALLKDNVAGKYAPVDGIVPLKKAAVTFAKKFLNITFDSRNCIPTVGSINGAYLAALVAFKRDKIKDQFLFLDPGFSVHKQMVKSIGLKEISLDIYHYRNEKLRIELEKIFKSGKVSAMLFSNPNNPTWICLSKEELKIIGELADRYGVIVIEDLAYFGMDFRNSDKTVPTVAHYTKNAITLISTSKLFSYAGQRIGLMLVSDSLAKSRFSDLKNSFEKDEFILALISAIYTTTAGPAHSAQVALTKMLTLLNNGSYKLTERVQSIEAIAKKAKALFLKNGFTIPYVIDVHASSTIGDGFYFTIAYPGFSGNELVKELFTYGISTISLDHTGALKTEAVRVSLSLVKEQELDELEKRLKLFNENVKSLRPNSLQHEKIPLA